MASSGRLAAKCRRVSNVAEDIYQEIVCNDLGIYSEFSALKKAAKAAFRAAVALELEREKTIRSIKKRCRKPNDEH